MGSDDFCSTGLELGLGLCSSSDDNHCKPVVKSQSPPPQQNREPSLNLTLSGETHDDDHHHHFLFRSDDHIIKAHVNDHHHIKSADDHHHLHRQDSGGVSSFSNNNLSLKRERVVDYHCSKVSDEEDDEKYGLSNNNVRKKLRLTKAQSALLEESFKIHSTLNPRQKQELARELKLRPRQVEVWFQNRRARTKLKQTEVDCELLKKCCENLTQENLRLHKEIQRLKSLTHRHYKQCPSCERSLCGRHFTNSNHPSAAC